MTTGQELRDSGIAQVLENAGDWPERCKAALREWFDSRPQGFKFTGETLTEAARELGLPEPHDPHARGGVAFNLYAEWRKAGRMEDTGRCVFAKFVKTRRHKLPEYEKTTPRRYQFAAAQAQMELLA